MQTRNEKQRNTEQKNEKQKNTEQRNDTTNPNHETTKQGGLQSGWLSFFPEPDATVYGINHDCIVAVLTEANWRSGAVVRVQSETNRNETVLEKVDATGWLYLWIREVETDPQVTLTQLETSELTSSQSAFQVRCFTLHPCPRYEAQFEDLAKALDYINGLQPESELARHTRIARREEWPPEMEAASLTTAVRSSPNSKK